MKFFLVLCLLAAISCFDFVAFVQCIAQKPAVQELVMKIISVIYQKDYKKIIEIVLASFTPVYNAIKECL